MQIRYEVLDKNLHNRDDFDCKEQSLNNFLKFEANQSQKKYSSITHVAVGLDIEPPKIIYGYYTLVNNIVFYNKLPGNHTKLLPELEVLPSIKIARIARNYKYTNRGFGENILMNALRKTYELATTQCGVYLVDVDLIHERVKNFYQKLGFNNFVDDKTKMFITMKTIRKLVSGRA